MKINSFFAVILTALSLFSCSQENVDKKDEDKANGRLAMAVSTGLPSVQMRAIDDSKLDGTTIQSLVVRSLDISGNTVGDDIVISPAQLAEIIKSTSTLPLTDTKRIVEQVNKLSTQIEVRGYNNITAPIWREKSELDAASITTLQLGAMPFANIPFISVNANGRDAITKTGNVGTGIHEGHEIWTSELAIKPYFARLEVTGTPTEVNNAASFNVKGIYINNIALVKGAEKTKYEGNGGIWEVDNNGKITGTTGDMDHNYKTNLSNMYNETLTGYDNKVDAYTLWGQTGMLHIVVKLEVVPINGDPTYMGFITLKNITGALNIEIGNIYKIDLKKLQIKYDKDVDPQPYDQGADLYLSLTVHNWAEVTLNPGL